MEYSDTPSGYISKDNDITTSNVICLDSYILRGFNFVG